MDYPKSVPNVGLVNGKFIDENATTGQVGSLIPCEWGNAVTDEILAVIHAAGLEPSEVDRDQLLEAIRSIIQGAIPEAPASASENTAGVIKLVSDALLTAGVDDARAITAKKLVAKLLSQGFTGFTTAGGGSAYTLSPVPALAAYASCLRYRVKFHEATSEPATLNVSGRGPKSLKQYDANGGKVSAVIAADQLADVEYDGVDFVLLDRLPNPSGSGIRGTFSNLKLSATGTNTNIAISADALVLENNAGAQRTVRNVALSITQGGSLDAGLIAASTWYSVWVIATADGSAVAAITSLSATAPAVPGGYTYKARVGWFRTDATGNKFPLAFCQFGRQVRLVVGVGSNMASLPSMAGGVLGNPGAGSYVAVGLAPFVPVTASAVDFFAYAQSAGAYYMVADTNAYGTYLSTTNPPPIASGASTSTSAVDFWRSMSRLMLTAGQNLYCASNAADFNLRCLGWEDNL